MKIMYKKLLIMLLLIASSTANAYDFNYKWSTWYIDDNLKNKIDILVERKMWTPELKLKYFNILKKYDLSNFNETKRWIINYLFLKLDPLKANIVKAWTPVILNPPIVQEPVFTPIIPPENNTHSWPRIFTNSYSSELEKRYVETLRKSVREYIEVNADFEYTEYGNAFLIDFKETYKIDTKIPLESYKQIKWIGRELLFKRLWNYYITSWGYSVEKKLTLKDIISTVKFSWTSDEPYTFNIRDWYYYIYTFYDIKYYTITDWEYLSRLKWIQNLKDTVLLKKWNELILVFKFWESRLFPASNLSEIKNPKEILNAIWRDMENYKWSDYESTLASISSKTKELIKWTKTEEEKIKAIYSWITWNIKYDEYSKKFVQWKIDEKTYLAAVDNDVFTWIWSYKKLNAVCDWYTKLFLYMLAFAWVNGISTEIWTVTQQWITVSHAWNRIWNKLYDSTWDINSLWVASKFKWYALSPEEMYKTHIKK